MDLTQDESDSKRIHSTYSPSSLISFGVCVYNVVVDEIILNKLSREID
jgi:hypothetical protein